MEENIFSRRMQELESERDLKYYDIASAIGVAPSAYYTYRSGRSFPKPEILIKIAEFFGVSTDYLIGKSDYRNAKEEMNDIDYAVFDASNELLTIIEKADSKDGIMFNGRILDYATAMLLKDSLENTHKIVQALEKKYEDKDTN